MDSRRLFDPVSLHSVIGIRPNHTRMITIDATTRNPIATTVYKRIVLSSNIRRQMEATTGGASVDWIEEVHRCKAHGQQRSLEIGRILGRGCNPYSEETCRQAGSHRSLHWSAQSVLQDAQIDASHDVVTATKHLREADSRLTLKAATFLATHTIRREEL